MDKKEMIEVPSFEGYECIGFVAPYKNLPCYFVDQNYSGVLALIEASKHLTSPRICYRKTKPNRYVFEETGEFRNLRYGDYCIMHGVVTHWSFNGESSDSYKILRRVENENE